VLLACAAACRKSAPARTVASVDLRSSCDARAVLSQCTDYAARALAAGERFLQGPCSAVRGAFASAPCPAGDRVGSCEVGGTEVRRFYGTGPNRYERARARRECAVAQGNLHEPGSE
jgi:hypothetical protein